MSPNLEPQGRFPRPYSPAAFIVIRLAKSGRLALGFGLHPVLESGNRAGHCLHQDDAGGAVLHAREIRQREVSQDGHRGLDFLVVASAAFELGGLRDEVCEAWVIAVAGQIVRRWGGTIGSMSGPDSCGKLNQETQTLHVLAVVFHSPPTFSNTTVVPFPHSEPHQNL